MRRPPTLLIALCFLLAWDTSSLSDDIGLYQPIQDQGPFEVEFKTFDWKDSRRDRPVPVKIYSPRSGKGPFPVIVFSHGLGGSREGYGYLGRHWASHGYVSVHLQHVGSDEAVWRGSRQVLQDLRRAAADPQNALQRPQDVRFVIDQIVELNRSEDSYKGRLDLDRIGMAGHSFGAHTTLAVVGQLFITPQGRELSSCDPRIKAAIPMSPPVTRNQSQLAKTYAAIKVPCFHMTGTRDHSPINDTTPEERLLPYKHCTGSEQYLLVFKDGDHMIFSGRPRAVGNDADDAHFQSIIRVGSTAFWDAYLRRDPRAKAWLDNGGFKALLGSSGTFDHKRPRETSE